MEAETVVLMVTIVVSVLVSTLATISLLLGRIDRLEDKFDKRFDAVDGGFKTVHGGFKAVDGEFKQVRRDIAGLGERLARIEGHLMAPGGFTLPTPQPSVVVDPPPGIPVPAGAKLGSGRQAEPPVVVATGLTGSIPSDS